MFTIVDALLLRPVPFRAPEQLASVYMGSPTGGRTTVAPSVLGAWRDTPAFTGAESAEPSTALLDTGGNVVTRGLARVTPGLFDLLGGVRPVRGRLFDAAEGRAGNDDRVLISEDLWRSVYQGDPDIVGRRVTINATTMTVIGVLPSDFRFPRWDTVIWRPIAFDASPGQRPSARAMAYVRFADTMPREEARRLATAAARAADASNAQLEVRDRPIGGLVLDAYSQRAVPLLGGGVILVFLVLCANVCSLLLTRLSERRREFSMRAALGASRARLVRQALVESSVLGVLGVAVGAGMGWALISFARAFLPEAFLMRTLNPLNLDSRALIVTSASGLVATLAAGLLPAIIGTRVNAGESLRVMERGGTETRSARAVTSTLLVVEIAMACTLLVSATLLVRSFINLSRADRGLNTSGVITATLSLSSSSFPDAAARSAVARAIEDHVRQLPGVEQVAWSMGLPPDGGGKMFGDWTSDAPGMPRVNMNVNQYNVGADFFALYGIPLLKGRSFAPADTTRHAIIGERVAAALWPGLDPIGRTFQNGRAQFHVIGVAKEINYPSLDPRDVDWPEFYLPFGGVGDYAMVSVRCGSAAMCPDAAVVRQRIGAVHPAARPLDVQPLDEVYLEQLARPRGAAALGIAFAAIAVLAAAGGLFSVLSYAVGRRRREFGIRAALGASPAQMRSAVLRGGFAVAAVGVVIGAAAALLLGRALSSLQYGVTMWDPVSWVTVVGVLASTTLVAMWRPARQAMRVDPVALLREE
jgi:predicted permease